jgi:hypothetical protein
MYSALVGLLFLLSIGILMAHAMEGHWLVGRRVKVIKDNASSNANVPRTR